MWFVLRFLISFMNRTRSEKWGQPGKQRECIWPYLTQHENFPVCLYNQILTKGFRGEKLEILIHLEIDK